MDDYIYGKTFIDPKHVEDGSVTPEHVRRWKLLQELQARLTSALLEVLLSPGVQYLLQRHSCEADLKPSWLPGK